MGDDSHRGRAGRVVPAVPRRSQQRHGGGLGTRRRLAIRIPPAPDGSVHAFEYLIEARDGGKAILRFVHSGVMGDDWNDEYQSITSGGWDMYLYTLAQYHRHFAGLPAVYIEAEGPASSAAIISVPLDLTPSCSRLIRITLTSSCLNTSLITPSKLMLSLKSNVAP